MGTSLLMKPGDPLTKTAQRVASSGERLALRKGRRIVAALVSVQDFRFLEQMDRQDVFALREAEADAAARGLKPVPWASAKKSLRL